MICAGLKVSMGVSSPVLIQERLCVTEMCIHLEGYIFVARRTGAYLSQKYITGSCVYACRQMYWISQSHVTWRKGTERSMAMTDLQKHMLGI